MTWLVVGCGGGAAGVVDGAVDGTPVPKDATTEQDAVPGDVARDNAGTEGGACNVIIEQHPLEGGSHVEQCSPTQYATSPPSSGDHYPVWAAYRTYDQPVPAGFLVHSLEHGAVVISYNCSPACPTEVARVQAFIDSLPRDPLCTAGRRIILAPDPNLDDARFAASAWLWTLRTDCFNETPFQQFMDDHYGRGPENFCEPPGADLSATNWCPA